MGSFESLVGQPEPRSAHALAHRPQHWYRLRRSPEFRQVLPRGLDRTQIGDHGKDAAVGADALRQIELHQDAADMGSNPIG
jgi:hypothetical protein